MQQSPYCQSLSFDKIYLFLSVFEIAGSHVVDILDDIVGIGDCSIGFFPNAFDYLLHLFFSVVKGEQRIVCGVFLNAFEVE